MTSVELPIPRSILRDEFIRKCGLNPSLPSDLTIYTTMQREALASVLDFQVKMTHGDGEVVESWESMTDYLKEDDFIQAVTVNMRASASTNSARTYELFEPDDKMAQRDNWAIRWLVFMACRTLADMPQTQA